MPEEKKAENPLMRAFTDAIKGQLADGRKHGWKEADSMELIIAIVAEDASQEIPKLVKAGKKPESYCLSDEAAKLIREHCLNSSATRQRMEKGQLVFADGKKLIEPLPEGEGKRARRETVKLYS